MHKNTKRKNKDKEIIIEEDAPVSSRLIAFLIDIIIIYVIILSSFKSALSTLGSISIFQAINNQFILQIYTKIAVPIFTLIVAYYFMFDFLIQTTPGKSVMNILLIDKDNKKPNAWKCLVRDMLFYPSLIFLIWWVFDLYYLFKNKTRLTDKLLGLRTVQVLKTKTQV